jgi:hypothetical protein
VASKKVAKGWGTMGIVPPSNENIIMDMMYEKIETTPDCYKWLIEPSWSVMIPIARHEVFADINNLMIRYDELIEARNNRHSKSKKISLSQKFKDLFTGFKETF